MEDSNSQSNKGNISINKNVYNYKPYKQVIDTEFSELYNAGESFSIEEFFNIYNELFLQIPITGDLSHTSLIRKSEQLVTPDNAKDNLIENLQKTIESLQLELETKGSDLEKEHPVFPNGSLIARFETSPIWPNLFIMDKGYKRAIDFSGDAESLKGFKASIGYDNKPVPRFPDKVVDGVLSGKSLNFNNINERWDPTEEESELANLRLVLDPSNASLNPNKYSDKGSYRSALEKDYEEKSNFAQSIRSTLEDLRNRIQQITGK